MIRLGIIDDHKMFREGLRSIIEDMEGFKVLWTAADSIETHQNMKAQQPDILLMDLSLGEESGFVLTNQLLRLYPKIKILILSMHQEDSYIIRILEMGAHGYLLKDAGSEEMIRAIRTINKNDTYYSKHVSDVLIKHISKGTKAVDNRKVNLTKRELEILKLIAEEYSNPEIAQMLYISIRTVDTHRRNLLDKLGTKNTAGLVKHAIQLGLVDLEAK